MKFNVALVLIILIAVFANSCKKENKEDNDNPYGDYNPTPYDLKTPNGFPQIIIPDNNAMTEEGVELGRMLYYDPILDKDSSRACANCHTQANSFTNSVNKSMHHVNLGWNKSFLWDGKVTGELEDIMLFEVEDFFFANFDRFNNSELYKEKFYYAFGVTTITSAEAAKALAQFLRTVISSNSKFDKYNNYTSSLTDSEMRGLEFFNNEKGDCFHCHGTVLFTDGLFHNNALDTAFIRGGLGDITGDPNDYGKFKSPTLRNVELTAPYMHDGRFNTLEEVINFYSEGQQYSSTVDPLLWRAREGGAHFTTQEKEDLLAFLKTLTDTDFINNPELSSPF